MKKTMLSLVVLLVVLSGAWAEESTNRQNEWISVSWSASYDGQPEAFSRISVLGLGFVVFQNEVVHIRNEIEFSNGVMIMEDEGVKNFKKVFGNKISLGIISRAGLFRPYGFIEGRVGTSGEELYIPLENPVVWNVGLGTGLDIFATKHWSFFQEMGFLGNFEGGEFIPQQRFELGVMFHFGSRGE